MVNRYKTFAPLKVLIESIAHDFNSLCAANKELYSFGLEYRWLVEKMDCSRMGFPDDLPWHARIGIGHHAGRVGIEEEFLVRDAFFMLESAEESFAHMNAHADRLKNQGKDDDPDSLKILNLANHNVAAYSRLSIISFFSFVEAFVNSVGYDFSLRNQSLLTREQIEILNGRKKGRLISVEYKIEKFPSFLRADKRTPIVISDPVQLKEPFTSFVQQVKVIRDSSVHYSPIKEAIWRRPLDWLENARYASKLCIEVAQEFWKACYPGRTQPQYLGALDYDKHAALAKARLKAKSDAKHFLRDTQPSSDS